MGVALLDLLDDKVSGRAKGDVARHAPRHARVEEGNHLPLGIEDVGAQVVLVREFLLVEVEDGHLPGRAPQVVDHIGLALGEPPEGQVNGLPLFRDDEARVALLVEEVRVLEALSVDAALDAEEMVGWVFEGGKVGVVGVEELDDVVGLELPA